MTILHPDPIIARLEKDGKNVVQKKLEQGVYADYEIPLIKKWLKDQVVEEASTPAEGMSETMAEFAGGF